MSASLQTFTAARIALTLGKKRQSVARQLDGITADKEIFFSGNLTKVWAIASLPARLQSDLTAQAERRGYRNAEAMLSAPPKAWQPPMPLSEIADSNLNRAAQLQRALLPSVQRQEDTSLNAAEFETSGVEDYKKVFGHEISARHFRDLFKRTIQRDGGAENWSNLALYLDERPARKIKTNPATAPCADEFRPLQQIISAFKNLAEPTAPEIQHLWLSSFDLHDDLVATGKKPKKAKLALLKFLQTNAPRLAESPDALRVAWNRKHARWVENGRKVSALADGRKEKSGYFRAPALSETDRDKIIAHARFNCGGRISQAWRELCQRGQLSEEILSYYLHNPASKSHVPKAIRDLATHEVKLLNDIHHGPRQNKLNGAHILRDWSGVHAQDYWQSDDCTLGIYTFIPNAEGWFDLIRGQFLPMIDLRSTRILNFAFLPERNYNARAIRTLITKTADEFGLPRKGFYFENGIWRDSKILKGASDVGPFSSGEVELGLGELGLKFVHAKLPRGKPIERIIGMLQDLLDGEPGYAGRDERHDRYERFQKLKLQIENKKTHPAEHLYNLDQWENRLHEICEQYNATPQNGKMTQGLSPDDAYFKFQNFSDPPIKLDASCRFILASHKRPISVTGNGITLRFGKQVYNYKNETTGRLRGQRVLAWFDPDLPEILTVTDMQRQNAFCVHRSQEVPAMDAPPEILEQELARNEAHQKYSKTRYRILRANSVHLYRPNFVSAQTAELGRVIEAGKVESKKENQLQARARKSFGKLGAAIPSRARAETIEAADELAKMLQKDDE